MHPTLWAWQRARRSCRKLHGCNVREGRGHEDRHWEGQDDEGHDGGGSGGESGFGIRRPLRFLAHQLSLDDGQIAALARVLDELKTERAQCDVNRRRTVAAFADALGGDVFDMGKASEAGDLRVKSAESLREAVVSALKQLHALLKPEQRERLSYLIRTDRLAF